VPLTTAGAFLAMVLTNLRASRKWHHLRWWPAGLFHPDDHFTAGCYFCVDGKTWIDHKNWRRCGAPVNASKNIWLDRPILVMAIVGTLCLLSLTQVRKVYFDYNVLNMEKQGYAGGDVRAKLIDSAG